MNDYCIHILGNGFYLHYCLIDTVSMVYKWFTRGTRIILTQIVIASYTVTASDFVHVWLWFYKQQSNTDQNIMLEQFLLLKIKHKCRSILNLFLTFYKCSFFFKKKKSIFENHGNWIVLTHLWIDSLGCNIENT